MTTRKGFSKQALEEQIRNDAEFAKHFKEAVNEGIGEALRDARRAAGLNQKDVAERMGVSEARVTQLEGTTGTSITLRSLRRFATAVNCRLDISLVSPTDSSVVSKLFVVDDYAPEPVQIETENCNIAAALADALTQHRTIITFPKATELHDRPIRLYFTKHQTSQGHSVQMTEAPQPVWVPGALKEKHVGTGV